MGTPWSEKSLSRLRRVVEELVKGRDSATQLRILLQKPPSTGDYGPVVSAEEIMLNILKSFDESLSVLSSCDLSGDFRQIPASTQVGSPSCGDQLSVDSGESTKRPPVKDRRGSYKRRKTHVDSWIEVSPSTDDGYAWRKYGQKEILNAKYPRCYYRCTHKHDLDCKANKQVQRIQAEDPKVMYQTTYFGHHTCRDTPGNNSKIINSSEFDHNHGESYLSFESKTIPCDQNHHHHPRPYCGPSAPSVEEKTKEEEQSVGASDGNVIVSPSSSLDSIVLPDLIPLESTGRSSILSDDHRHEDHAISTVNYSSSGGSSGSDHGLGDIDSFFIMKSVDIENYFCFDDLETHHLL